MMIHSIPTIRNPQSGHFRKWGIHNRDARESRSSATRNPQFAIFNSQPPHHGFTIIEVLVATAMLATLFALVSEMIVFAHIAQRKTREQAAVQQAADNLLEQISGLPWEAIRPDADFTESLSAHLVDDLADVTWDVTVTEESKPLPAKRIAVRVVRPAVNGRASPTVRLTAWIIAPVEDLL